MKKRWIKGLAFVAAGVTAFTVVVVLLSFFSRSTGDLIPLRLGLQDNAVCALPYIADHMGYFRRQGLAVEVVAYPSGKLALQALFNGEVDAATVADVPIVTHSFDRDDFAVFATIAWTDDGAWIIGRRDRGIAEAKDLRGKTIATQRDSAVHFFLSAFLARHGIAEREVELRFMQAEELPGALAAGRIDAFCMRNPFVARAKARIGSQAVEFFDPHIYRQTFNLVTWKRALAADPSVWKRLLRAIAQAEQLLIRDGRKARQAVIARIGQDREHEILDEWDSYTFTLALDQSLFVTLEDQARWIAGRSPARRGDIPNYWHFVATGPLLAVKPDAVNVIR